MGFLTDNMPDVGDYVKFTDSIAKAVFNWTYEQFCQVMHDSKMDSYTEAKWKLFASQWTSWWGQLDQGNRERFVKALTPYGV